MIGIGCLGPARLRRVVLLAAPGRAHLPGQPGDARRLGGVSWSHTQAHFFRAILESVAFEYAYYLRILRELLPDLKLSQPGWSAAAPQPVWNQIKADVLGVPYQRLAGNEFGTWGAAMIAGKAAGVIDTWRNMPPGQRSPRVACSARPGESAQLYQPLVEKYIQMEAMLDQFFSKPI